MDMPITQITSNDLIPIEQPFRVAAGPGAGKTYWLVKHIKNILHNSQRLGKTRKIACITYTNVAVETILKRLDSSSNRVEVSTIHSFLYKNVVKPYLSLISHEYKFDVSKMDGHEDHNVSFAKVRHWIENHPNIANLTNPYTPNQLCNLETNKAALIRWLSTLKYSLDGRGNLEIITNRIKAYYYTDTGRRNLSNACLDVLSIGLQQYKELFWENGTLHHDDVLFFSFELIRRFPFILTILRVKFPYFFVDEFQDTNPIQTELLRLIGQKETVIGVIGDKAQSIYGFQGAVPMHFQLFALPNIQDYQMADNRRSTNQNINLLNYIRPDLTQNNIRNENMENPLILIGGMNNALKKCQEICGDELVYSLTRKNVTANSLKRELNGINFNNKLTETCLETDKPSSGNGYRSKVIVACVKATELAREKKFKEAIRELDRIFRDVPDIKKKKKIVLKTINLLLQNRQDLENKPLIEFHNFIHGKIRNDISTLRAGGAKDFYEAHTYQQLALCVRIKEDNSLCRTIHGAKGDEFDNVLLVLRKETSLEFLLNPDLNKERHRIYYVAVSRARNRLFINTPTLSPDNQRRLSSTNFEILQLI